MANANNDCCLNLSNATHNTSLHSDLHTTIDTCSYINLGQYEYDDDNRLSPHNVMHNIDPDNHFYRDGNQGDCKETYGQPKLSRNAGQKCSENGVLNNIKQDIYESCDLQHKMQTKRYKTGNYQELDKTENGTITESAHSR